MADDDSRTCMARFDGGPLAGTVRRWVRPAPQNFSVPDFDSGRWVEYWLMECDYTPKKDWLKTARYLADGRCVQGPDND